MSDAQFITIVAAILLTEKTMQGYVTTNKEAVQWARDLHAVSKYYTQQDHNNSLNSLKEYTP